ncbi:MAG: PKD domain-containing protein [Bacteroidetes bacterium]|nr:PKD domain-containing protein [Bacteroidota bacterium]
MGRKFTLLSRYVSAGKEGFILRKNSGIFLMILMIVFPGILFAQCTGNFTFFPNNQCAGMLVSFTSSSVSSGLTYHWNFDDPASGINNTSTLQNPTHLFEAHGAGSQSFNVSLVVTASPGCHDSVVNVVTVLQKPDASITDTSLLNPWKHCVFGSMINATLVINNTSTTIATNTHYHIDWGDGTPHYDNNVLPNGTSHLYTTVGNFGVVLTVTNAQCSETKTFYYFNGSNPGGGLDPPGSTVGLCGIPQTFSCNFTPNTLNNAPGTIYTIHYDDGSPDETYTQPPPLFITHTYLDGSCGHLSQTGVANSYAIKCTISNPCSSGTISYVTPIQISEQPVPNFSISPDPVCTAQNLTLTSTTPPTGFVDPGTGLCTYFMSYQWTITPASYTIISGNLTSSTLTIQVSTAVPYSITLAVATLGCNSSPITKTICVTDPPISAFTVDKTSGCFPLTVQTNNTSSVSDPCGPHTYLWSVTNYSGSIDCPPNTSSYTISDINAANPTITFNNPGVYRLNLSVIGSCATVTTFQDITVKTVPNSLINVAMTQPICAGQSITPTANIFSCLGTISAYSWNFTPGGSPGSSTTNPPGTITYTNPGTFPITVNATNECGTGPDNTVNLTVKPLPVVTLAGPSAVCVGVTGNVYTTQAGMANYLWSVSGGGMITAGGTGASSTVTVTWNTVGPQTVSVNYQLNGCYAASPTVYNVTVNPRPSPTISGLNSVCAGTTGVIYTTEAGMSGYTWTVSAGGTITAGAGTDAITVTWSTAGVKTVTVNYSNAFGCAAVTPTSYSVTVNTLPVPPIAGNTPICIGLTAVYTTQAAMTNYVWSVSAGGSITAGGTATDNTVTVTWNVAGAQSVSINYTDGNGCTAAAPVVYPVNVLPPPTPTIAGSNSVCVGSTGNVYTTQAGMTNYVWTVSAGGTVTAGGTAASSTVTVTWNTLGAQTVSVNYTQAGCPALSPFVFNVTVNPRPVPTISGLPTLCAGTTGVVYTTEPGMSGYTWTVSAGGSITAGAGTSAITVTWNTAGAQTVTVNYSNAFACPALTVTSYPVTVNALPVPTIAGTAALCAGTSAVYTTQGGMTNYTWTVSAGGTITAGGTTTDNTVTVTWNTAGAQSVSINYTNANGCQAAAPVVYPVTVTALPTPTIAGPGLVCAGTAGNVYTTQAGKTNYVWTVSAGGTITAGGTAASSTVTVTWNTVGAQTVSVNYTQAGCSAASPFVFNVTVDPRPSPTISGLNAVCAGTTGVFYTTEAGMSGYTWTVSAGGTITAGAGTNAITVTWSTAGARTVTVNYSNAFGCAALAATTYPVTVNALPAPTISGTAALCAGASATYTTQAGMANYTWTVTAGGTITAGGTTTDNTVTVTWNTPGAWTVSINYNDGNGCAASTAVSQTVTVNPLPIPTVAGPDDVCINTTGNVYTTEAGKTNYQWIISPGGVVTAGGTATSNTVTVSWVTAGLQSVSVNYSAAGCTAGSPAFMSVEVYPLPITFTVTGGGSYPMGGAGVPVGLSNSQVGVEYELVLDFITPILPRVTGTGTTITFGNQLAAGTYRVTAYTLTSPTCPRNMLDSAVVVINPYPNIYNVTGGGVMCAGDSGVHVGLDNSSLSDRYVLLLNGDSIANLPGTGNPLDFGLLTAPGIYTVRAITVSTGLTLMMTGNAVIVVNPIPVAFLIVPAGDTCPGVEILLNGSEAGILYYLIRNANDTISMIVGTGTFGFLNFGHQYLVGIYRIVGINPTTGCKQDMTGTVNILPAPAIFTIFPPGIICPGTSIILPGSETGISYQLRRDSLTSVGLPLPGTGLPLDFGPQTIPGVYSIIATNPLTHCYNWMNGRSTIQPQPTLYSIMPNGDTCAGAIIRLNGSQTGIRYRLILNGTIFLDSLMGTGNPLVFGTYFTSGFYTIVAVNPVTRCETLMTGTLHIESSPTAYNVIPNGVACVGDAVGLDNSEIGINYELIRDGVTLVAGPIPGTGGALSFGTQGYAGVYTIEAVNGTTSCSRIMNGSATLSPLPTSFLVQPTGTQCAGTDIFINGSEIGVNYELRWNGITQQTKPGTGAFIHFGPQFLVGTYTVRAINALTTCDTLMTGSTVITPLPLAFNITPAGANCSPTTVGVAGSEAGVNYQLFKNGFPVGLVSGTGGALSFGLQTDGTYFVIATILATSCKDTMTGTVIIIPGPTVNAGNDTSTCGSKPVQMVAQAISYSTVLWSSAGDGSFSNPNILNPFYTPGPLDNLSGLVKLTVQVTGQPACSQMHPADSLMLTIDPVPVATAGPDDTICTSQTAQLNGTAQHQSTVHWKSFGDGTFNNSSILNPVYTPGSNDKTTGSVLLRLVVHGLLKCTVDTAYDDVVLIIQPMPSASAGSDATICESNSYSLSGTTLNSSSVAWSTTGDGTFDNASILNPVYTPGSTDKIIGSVRLVITAYGTGSCISELARDTMKLTINHLPLVNAGPDATICETYTYTVNGTASIYSSIQWSTSGDGLFANISALSTVYTPGPADLTNGSVQLKLTAVGQIACTGQSRADSMVLTFHTKPIAHAGNDTIVCPNVPVMLNGSASNYTSILWTSIGGDGTFDNPAILNPQYTPGTGDIANGFVRLVITVNGQLQCSSQLAKDTVRVDYHILPTASVSGTTTICAGTTTGITFTLTGISPWSIVYSDGVTSTPIINIPASPYTIFVTPPVTTTYSIVSISDQFCNGTISGGPAIITVKPLPLEFAMTVTGNGSFCEGGSGVAIGIDGSQTGIEYQLLLGGMPDGFPMPGNGGPISFGTKTTPGTYKVRATNPLSNCQRLFSDSVTVVVFPKPDVDFRGDSACQGQLTYFHLQGADIGKIATWNWNFGDGNTVTYSAPIEPTHLYPTSGTYQVILSVVDTNGCTKTAQHAVNVYTLPVAMFGFSAPTCNGIAVTLTSYSFTPLPNYITTWHWVFGDGTDTIISWPGNPNVTHLYPAPGTYSVSLTVTTDKGCSAVKVRTIAIDPAPVVNFDYTAACGDNLTQFNDLTQTNGGGSVVEWYWNFGDPTSGTNNSSTVKNPVHIFTHSGDFNVRLRSVTSNGCQDSIIKVVHVNQGPAVNFSYAGTCLQTNTTFTDLTLPNSASILTWDWDFGDGSLHSSQQSPVHTYTNSGIYNVILTITNSNQCTHDTTIAVEIIPKPTAQFQSDAPTCLGVPVHYTNLSTTLHGQIIRWTWDFGDGNTATINFPASPNVSHVFQGLATQHTVRLTVITTDSCSSFVEHLINTIPTPIASFGFSNIRCVGQDVQFTDLTQLNGGTGIASWYWNFGDPTSGTANFSMAQNPLHSFTSASTFNVMLIVTNITGCTDTVSLPVTISEKPTAQFSADTVCLGTLMTFTDQSIAIASSIVAWNWDFGDGSPHSMLQNPTHLYASAGVHTVTLIVTNSNGCTGTVTHQVLVTTPPVAAFVTSSSNCAHQAVSFTDQSFTTHGYIVRWTWVFGDGNSQTVSFPNPQNVTHTYAAGGNYNSTLTIQTSDSCSNTSGHVVTVYDAPVANFTSSATHCKGMAVQFTDQSQLNGGGPINGWEWNFGDPGSGTSNTSTQQNPQHIFNSPSSFNVTLITTNIHGCKDTIMKQIDINSSPTANFVSDSVCKGSPTHFTDQSVGNSGTITSWLWNFGDGTPNSTVQNPTHTYANFGSYNVMLTVTNSSGCQSDTILAAVVNAMPDAFFTFTGGCAGSMTQFTDSSTLSIGLITGWLWDFGDGDTSHQQNPSHIYSTAGTYVVILTVTSGNGCSDSYTLPVVIFTKPTAAFSYYSNYCPAGQVTFADHSTGNGAGISGWNWDFGDGFTSVLANPVHVYTYKDSTYHVTLIVTNTNGCNDTLVDSTVFVKPGFNFTFSADSVCFGEPTHFIPVNLATGDTLHDVSWKFNDPNSGTYNTSTLYYPTHVFTSPGVYTVKFKAWDSDNCVDSVYLDVIVYAPPVANFTFDSVPYCDSTVLFRNLSTGNGSAVDTLIWNFGDGNTLTQTAPVPLTASHTYGAFGTYSVTLTTINSRGCRDTISKQVLVSCIAAIYSNPDTLHCSRSPVIFIDSSGPVSLINSWYWEFGDATNLSYTTRKPSITHEYQLDGIYTVMLVVRSTMNGILLTDTSYRTITVKSNSFADFSVPAVCLGDSSRFVNLSDSNGISIISYSWKFGEPASGPNDTTSLQDPAHRYNNHGKYDVMLIIRNQLGCQDTMLRKATVHKLPKADFAAPDICSRDLVTFANLSKVGDTVLTRYSWNFGDASNPVDTSNLQSPAYSFPDGGTYIVFLRVGDAFGCTDTVSKTETVLLSPISAFTIIEDVNGMPGRIKMNNESLNAKLYEWDFGNGTKSNVEEPVVTYATDGSYIIRLITWAANNCSDTTFLDYEFMFHNLFVPNAFSPENVLPSVRLFKPVGINLAVYHILVLDTWGHVLWESSALDAQGRPTEGWDGYSKGTLMAEDVYVWKISATFKDGTVWEGSDNGKGKGSTMGTVTMIR